MCKELRNLRAFRLTEDILRMKYNNKLIGLLDVTGMRCQDWKKTKTPLERVSLIVTYHPGFPPLKRILEKHSSILNVSERMRRAVRNPPLVVYRRSPNLRGLLVRVTFKQQQSFYRVNSHCQQPRCEMCHHMKKVNKFKSSVTKNTSGKSHGELLNI